MSKAARSLGVVRRAGKIYGCPRVLKNCFYAYLLSSLKYCDPVWISSAEFHLGLLDSIVRNAERLCEGELCCVGHKRYVGVLCLLYDIYHRVDHPKNAFFNNFVTIRNTGASATPGELALVISR